MRYAFALSLLMLFVPPGGSAAQEGKIMLSLTSPAFAAGQPMPKKYTCEGAEISPPLQWSGVPANAKSLALIVDDPDAPDPKAPQRVFSHWVMYNIPTTTTSLAEAASGKNIPSGAVEGSNDQNRVGYHGPCPPIGRHRYFFKLFALDDSLPAGQPLTKAALETAMKGHAVAQAELIGTYEKGQ
jgi:Raf kinase inhibitor-like YbhB/YbcL family protein